MVYFFRDILDGWLYVVVAILSLIFIIAIIGFMMERKQLERDKKNRDVVSDAEEDNMEPITNEVSAYEQTMDMNQSFDVNATNPYVEQPEYIDSVQNNEFTSQYTEPVSNPYVEANNTYVEPNHYVASANRANTYANSPIPGIVPYSNETISEVKADNAATNANIPSVLDFDAIDSSHDDLV